MPYFPLLFVSIWSASRHFLFPLTSALCSWGMALTYTACPYSNSVTIALKNLYMTLRQVMGRYYWGFPSQLSYRIRMVHPSTSHDSILEGVSITSRVVPLASLPFWEMIWTRILVCHLSWSLPGFAPFKDSQLDLLACLHQRTVFTIA